ncbi:MAG: riboflavin synthase [Pirellulales bacterium]|jgi:riboflavin synthase|nr:riboflavin synthase [Pirellulales bacterium]OUT62860.1 MAG: riboflavin synthase [Planctomycetaceae bacterium TMED10]|tara:strand:+ start:188 stop:781 length:594 start_codon:yes stop_codon:yes gene_type:complete
MFTGLVQTTGTIFRAEDAGSGRNILIQSSKLPQKITLGDSVAVNGCCLTVIEITEDYLAFEAGPETLSRTTCGDLKTDDRVNLECSLCVGDPLGGHFVTGHIDGVGELHLREDDEEWSICSFRVPSALTTQMISKGSIAVDGVSLTLVEVQQEHFTVQLIPHTLSHTTLGDLSPGGKVNIETDILAKYVQKSIHSER